MKEVRFWDTEYQDVSDLAVVVAGDICEQRINPEDYLKFMDDLEHLSILRLALLAGFHISQLDMLSSEEIDALLRTHFYMRFPGLESRPNMYLSLLKLLVLPFGRWSSNILTVEYSSLSVEDYFSVNLKDILMRELEFNLFDRYQNGYQKLVNPRNIIDSYKPPRK